MGAITDIFLRSWRKLSPSALLVLSFAALIGIGALGFLLLPKLTTGPALTPLQALFTATSAVCLTGLSVIPTATGFTRMGQVWLLILVQLGGIGLVALSTLVIGSLGHRLSLRSEMLSMPHLNFATELGAAGLLRASARFTFAFEAVGVIVFFILWMPHHGPGEAAWLAVFHAVNAFCNAGFSTFGHSLEVHATEPFTVLMFSLLIMAGGLGFLSTAELWRWWKEGGRRGRLRLSSHTWAVLVASCALWVLGALLFASFEWHGALAGFGLGDKLTNAWFMSVTTRSSGFSTIPFGELRNDSAYLSMLLMSIGGAPGSTAGGIKTTALVVLGAMAWSKLRGRRHVRLRNRSIPDQTVQRTMSLVVLVFVVITLSLFLLTSSETRHLEIGPAREAFLPLLFEAVSAFNTVGLSMSDAAEMSAAGQLILVVLMFMGRVGPLAFFAALSVRSSRASKVRPAQEDLVVG